MTNDAESADEPEPTPEPAKEDEKPSATGDNKEGSGEAEPVKDAK